MFNDRNACSLLTGKNARNQICSIIPICSYVLCLEKYRDDKPVNTIPPEIIH